MLQRAASNAYSWWWASHIRTRQSKWLEQSLQDMEGKVAHVLSLIQEDGDSFAKRAEMYYKHRPEIISFVEETVRAYRALAERYDKMSTDLQKANTTIASVCPDQVTYDMDYEDDYGGSPKMPKNFPPNSSPYSNAPIPKSPKLPNKDLKNVSKKIQAKKGIKEDESNSNYNVLKSGLMKDEAVEEIDRLQKEILSMQTMKEFIKSSYESGLAKYRDIESKIVEMQEIVSSLQDEFKVYKVIEDDDARTLMAEAALKSCEETLAKLEGKQEKLTQDAKSEHQRIEETKQKLKVLTHEYLPDQDLEEEKNEKSNEVDCKESEEKIEESVEGFSKKPMTVTEMAETVDKLVDKVISLESSVSSQSALIDRLRTETDDLHNEISNLENDKANLIDGSQNSIKKLKEMEEKLHGVQDMDRNIEHQNNSHKTHFKKARCDLQHVSEKLDSVKSKSKSNSNSNSKPEEPIDKREIFSTNDHEVKSKSKSKAEKLIDKEEILCINDDRVKKRIEIGEEMEKSKEITCTNDDGAKNSKTINETRNEKKISKGEYAKPEIIYDVSKFELKNREKEDNDNMSWQMMLLNGLEDKERILLKEYTAVLRDYKDTKKRLSEEEKRNKRNLYEMIVKEKDLKTGIVKRDNHIQKLKQKLKLLQETVDSNEVPFAENDEDDDINVGSVDESHTISVIEEKLRMDIDAILEENLDFWLRFSTTFPQAQKFKNEVEDLQEEIVKAKAKSKSKSKSGKDVRSEIIPLYMHLKEIKNELKLWLEQSTLLKQELKRRCLCLTNIQEEITVALMEGVEEEEIKFSTHQAAKFQGEILNMKQENNKVNEELEAGLDHVTTLQVEADKTLKMLEDEFALLDNNNNENQVLLGRSSSKSGIPLKSFIFGVKEKKQKPSIFSLITHHRKFSAGKGGFK